MKNLFLLLALLTMTHFAYGQGDAPTSIFHQSDNVKLKGSKINVPNKLATQLSNGTLLELGNDNILANPSFEHSTFDTSWTLTAGTAAEELSIVRHGKKAFKVSLSAQTLELYQDSTLYAGQSNDNGMAFAKVKTSVAGIFVCSRNAGVTNYNNCTPGSSANTYDSLRAPFVLGATSNGIAIVSGTLADGVVTPGNVTGDVYVDDAFVGAANIIDTSNDVKLAGSSYIQATASCSVARSNAAYGAMTDAAACPGPTIVKQSLGSWQTTDGNNLEQTINNLPAGVYKATWNVAVNTASGNNCAVAVSDGTTTGPGKTFGTTGVNRSASISAVFTYTSAGNRTFELYSACSAGGATTLINEAPTTAGTGAQFQLEYFGSNNTYTAPCGANCVDEFVAKVDASGNVTGENSDFINGNAVITDTSLFTYTFNTNLFTVAPVCTYSIISNSTSLSTEIKHNTEPSTTTLAIRTFASSESTAFSKTAYPHQITCRKTGADFTASRTIHGSFKDVPVMTEVGTPKMCGASVSSTGVISNETGNCFNGNFTDGSGTGSYVGTFNTGYFLTGVSCVHTRTRSDNYDTFRSISTSITGVTHTSGTSGSFNIFCWGK